MEEYRGPILSTSKTKTERNTKTVDGDQVWRQVGWLGQTGRVYSLDEKPWDTEPGGYAKLWILSYDEPYDPEIP